MRGSCRRALERQAPVKVGALDAESGALAATPSYSPRDLSFAAGEGLFSHLQTKGVGRFSVVPKRPSGSDLRHAPPSSRNPGEGKVKGCTEEPKN